MSNPVILFCFLVIIAIFGNACQKQCLEGSGLLVTEARKAENINAISINVPSIVYLSKSEKPVFRGRHYRCAWALRRL